MAELRVPALSVAVFDGGEVAAHAWGAEPSSLFQAASISKPVSAMGAVALAAAGVFDLDRDVNELLTSWQLPDGDGVTVRRLLSHTAGLGVHGFPGYEAGKPVPTTVQVLDGVEPANTDAVRVVRPVGEAWQYSGGGFTVMQLLLEDVTGEPFAALMRRLVLDPLEMRASGFDQPLDETRHVLAAAAHDGAGNEIAGRWHTYPERAAAGLWTTPTDLVSAAREMMQPGRALTLADRDAMLTPQVAEHFGVGWALEGAWFGHGGSNAGYRCQVYASVEHGRAVAVMTNSDNGGSPAADVIATIAETLGWPGFLREREAIDLDDATRARVVGVYEVQPGFDLTVRDVDGVLTSSAPGLPEQELFAETPTEFFRLDLDGTLVWNEDVITLTLPGTSITAKRKVSADG
jgi:CubicO group peptidase (beta-lactamase class C family)